MEGDQLNPRERFVAAISHRLPDCAPRYAEFTPQVLATFRDETGSDDPAEFFGYEMRGVTFHPSCAHPDYAAYYSELPAGAEIDAWGVAWEPAHLFHLSNMIHPLRNANSVAAIERYPLPDIQAAYRHADLEERIAAVHGLKLAAVSEWTTIFEQSWYLRGLDNLLLDMLERPHLAEALLDRVTDVACFSARRFAEAGADLIRTGDDIGTQRGMMMSAPMWCQWLKPRLARLVEAAKGANPAVRVLYDSDGHFEPVIPDLIEIGIDVLAPIQPECNDPLHLKREYGGDLAFWGSIGVQSTLPFGTPTDVRQEVKERLATLGQGGGLVIAPSHVIPPETPWENVVAFFAAVDEFGCYA